MKKNNEKLGITKLNLAEKYFRLSICANSDSKKKTFLRDSRRYHKQACEISSLFIRKLWDTGTDERWKTRKYTSLHPHGEPPEWNEILLHGRTDLQNYPLITHYGRGMATCKARKHYHSLCIKVRIPWENLSPGDKYMTQEQDGVFAYSDPVDAYWYGDEVNDNDKFVVFRGVFQCPGPEERSSLAKVVKPVAYFTRQEFVKDYFNGIVPAQPVNNLRFENNPHPPELMHEADEDDYDMPDLGR